MERDDIEVASAKERVVIICVVVLLIIGIGLIYFGLQNSPSDVDKQELLKETIKNTALEVENDLNEITNIIGDEA